MSFLGLPIVAEIAAKVTGIIDKLIPDVAAAAKLKGDLTLELMKEDWSEVMGQLEINKEEAKSSSMFVAGWRPAVGWTCALAFFYNFIFQPFFVFMLSVGKIQLAPLPSLDMNTMIAVLGGMLGLGGLRTYEKVKGVGGNNK